MTSSSHLWASAMTQCPNSQWEPVITSGFNPSLSVCHICCALFSFCCSFPEALYHHPFLLTLLSSLHRLLLLLASILLKNQHFQKQQPLLPSLTNQNTSAASEQSKERPTETHSRTYTQDDFENVLHGRTTSDSFQTLLNISFSLPLPFQEISLHICVCGVWCGHIAQVHMCLKKNRLYKCKILWLHRSYIRLEADILYRLCKSRS